MGFRHFIQCGVSVVNGSNHWVLQQPDQVNTIDPWPGKHEVVFAATSDHLSSHRQAKMEEPRSLTISMPH